MSPTSTVVLIHCEGYDRDKVREAVTRGLGFLGGAGRFAGRGAKVLLKPNLLIGDPPEKCVTTHPAVFRAVAEAFIAVGAEVSYGDSPSFGGMSTAARRSGIAPIAAELGVVEADFHTPVDIFFEQGMQNRRFVIARAVKDADVIVSIPKFKTHGFQKFTGCVKNQFGCVPGLRKGEYHVKLADANDFARMLIDLNRLVAPSLYVMDGICAMEGNGPRGGRPRPLNLLMFSTDPIACDATACRIVGLDPLLVPTIRFGAIAGAGTYLESEIELLGDDITCFIKEDFAADRRPIRPYRSRGLMRFVSNRLVPKPYLKGDMCVRCGKCVEMCPTFPKSIDWENDDHTKPPTHRYRTCIRCYCCQEVCPESAIELRYPILRKVFR